MKKFYVLTVFCIAIALFLSGCEKQQKDIPQTKLTITINSWIGWAPLYLAKEKGFYDKDNVEVEITRIEDTGTRKATMISGKVDGYASSVDNFALDSSEGVPGKIVLAFDESYGGDGIVAKKSIKSVKDLKGKQVAFQPGLIGHFLLLHVLDKAGLKEKDVQKVDMDSDKAGAAFTSGKLDAAVTWEPWLSKANEMSDGHILLTTKEYPGIIVDTLVFREEVLKNKRKAVESVLKSWFDALQYWKEHQNESDEIMAKSYGLPVDEFKAMVSGVIFYDYQKNIEYFGKDKKGPIYSLFTQAGNFWKENGIIKGEVAEANDKIDPSLLVNLY